MTATHKEPCLTGVGLKSRLLRGQPPLLASFLAGASLLIALDGLGSTFSLPAQASATNTLDLGLFSGGTVLTLQMSGQVDLGDTWNTWADGSLVSPVSAGEYSYVNADATNYPIINGGDSTNHFVGGGANYDVVSGSYGVTGAMTTDTTDPSTIRFGAVVGTFSSAPGRDDWFYVGVSNSVTVPTGGAHLYLAVNDAFHPNNTGSYSGVLTGQQQASISLSISGPTDGMIALTWGTVPGWKYQVEYSTNAASTIWSHLGSVLTATNSSLSVPDAIAPAPQRLYRVGGSP